MTGICWMLLNAYESTASFALAAGFLARRKALMI